MPIFMVYNELISSVDNPVAVAIVSIGMPRLLRFLAVSSFSSFLPFSKPIASPFSIPIASPSARPFRIPSSKLVVRAFF